LDSPGQQLLADLIKHSGALTVVAASYPGWSALRGLLHATNRRMIAVQEAATRNPLLSNGYLLGPYEGKHVGFSERCGGNGSAAQRADNYIGVSDNCNDRDIPRPGGAHPAFGVCSWHTWFKLGTFLQSNLTEQSDAAMRLHAFVEIAVPHLGSVSFVATLHEGWGALANSLADGMVEIRDVLLSFPSIFELAPAYPSCCAYGKSGGSDRKEIEEERWLDRSVWLAQITQIARGRFRCGER
jgi:hypothetical protein